VLVDGRPAVSSVTAVGLYGTELEVGYGSNGGWTVLGPERVVIGRKETSCWGWTVSPRSSSTSRTWANVCPAAGTALLFPLAVRAPAPLTASSSETVLGVDEARQSMTFAGDVPEGSTAQLIEGL